MPRRQLAARSPVSRLLLADRNHHQTSEPTHFFLMLFMDLPMAKKPPSTDEFRPPRRFYT
jgi:hypothetical protein